MKLKIKKKSFGITMFAMPDVAFLLLIFLILTSSVDEQGEITLPEFKFQQETDFPDTVTISAAEDGSLLFMGDPISSEGLTAALNFIPGTTVIHLMADRNIPYSKVDSLLTHLQSSGLYDVVLIMEERDDFE